MECFNNLIPQSWTVLPWSVRADAGGTERPLVQRVANMDHFLPSDTELSQQVDIVATIYQFLKWIKGDMVCFINGYFRGSYITYSYILPAALFF